MKAARLTPVVLAFALLAPFAVPALGTALAGVTVTVTDDASGLPVEGAFVALMGVQGQLGAVTNASGEAAFPSAAPGDYAMSISAPGKLVGGGAVVVDELGTPLAAALTDSGNIFDDLGAYGAQTSAILSDGLPGVFYLTTTAIPSLYRTADYGGHWAPVTISTDDPLRGIDGSGAAAGATTSGYPGEVAAIVGNKVWFSRDFGNSWRSITAPPTGNGGGLLWGHVDDRSMLFAVNGSNTEMSFADMPVGVETTVPTAFTAMGVSYKQDPNDEVTIGNGSAAPVVAVAPASGADVILYEVGSTPSRGTDASTTATGSGVGATPTFVRLGGPATDGEPLGAGTTPSTVLSFSNTANVGKGHAVMASFADPDGDTTFTWTATDASPVFHNQDNDAVNGTLDRWNQDPGACGGMEGSIGSVAPMGQTGTVSMCWVTQEGAGLADLHVRPVRFINNNTGIAYDAGYDGVSDLVLISGDGEKGATKSASNAAGLNRPLFREWPDQATAGTDASSDGVSVEGIGSAVIRDTDFGPGGENQVVTALSFTGGGRVLASVNGGDDWAWIAADGASAAEWWQTDGTNGSWILAGAGGQQNLLVGADVPADASTAGDVLDADVPTNALAGPGGPGGSALPGTGASDFGMNGADSPAATAIVGIPGAAMAYVGTATNQGNAGSLRKVVVSGTRLGNDRAATVSAPGNLSSIANPVTALTYCPTDGSHASTADTVFVALGSAGSTPGGIAAVRGAAGATPVVEMAEAGDTGIALSGDFNDVRADCAGGSVYAAKSASPGAPMNVTPTNPPPSGMMVSLDGGATFDELVLDVAPQADATTPSFGDVETFDVQPGDPAVPGDDDMLIVVGSDGDIAVGEVDATGANDFVAVNDTNDADGRSFGGERPGDINVPPPPAPMAASGPRYSGTPTSLSDSAAVLGSGAGLFSMESVDLTAPTAPALAALSVVRTTTTAALSWTASTDSESGIDSYLVRSRRAGINEAGYSSFVTARTVAGTATRSVTLNVSPGYAYCFRVTAVNGAGLGTTSNERCTAVPLDDPRMSKSSSVWRTYGPSTSYPGYYLKSYTQTTTRLAYLRTSVRGAKKLVLLATKCPTCGVVEVYIGTLRVSTLNLYASTVKKLQLVTAYSSSTARSGVVKIKVVSPNGKLVRVEGLASLR